MFGIYALIPADFRSYSVWVLEVECTFRRGTPKVQVGREEAGRARIS